MIHYIYKITNVINGKGYIGKHSTNNINDGYFGSGVACEKTNRRFIGIEKEKQYYDVAIRRLSEYSVQQYY